MFKPISDNHSISKVIANIFLPQTIIKPENVFSKLLKENVLAEYHKKGLSASKTININEKDLQQVVSNEEISGFVFEEFNAKGKSVNVFKVQNLNNNQKAQITFETKDYSRWSDFKNRYFDDLEKLSNIFEFYVEAISLNYIDEFIWDAPSKIPIDEIFNTDSELLNSNFTNSHNGTLVIISQSEQKKGEKFEEEKTEILFNNDFKRVIVNHTFAIRLEDLQMFTKESMIDLFAKAHEKNKDLLNKIFTSDVKALIKLK